MARITSFELFAVDLPFCKPFKHAAKERWTSDSIILKCETDSGRVGFGECLPRDYVSGESRAEAYDLLAKQLLPKLIGREFSGLADLVTFLDTCNGKAPEGWVSGDIPQTAAWAAVDLALLDAFGKAFNEAFDLPALPGGTPGFRYSVVFSGDPGCKFWKTLLLTRLYGFRQVKLKVDAKTPLETVRTARNFLGSSCDIRVDVNMAWGVETALELMPRLAEYGVRSFEQPLHPDEIYGMAKLVKETGLGLIVDESLNDAQSLETLIAEQACTAVNVRISKCGGLIAAYNRCKRALEKGLWVQVGCQVGESSLLSAAQLILIPAVGRVRYAEGCFGHHLLKDDPVVPLLQFGYGGRPPTRPAGPGLGVMVNEAKLLQWVGEKVKLD